MSLRSLIPLFAFLALMGALAFGLTRDPRILPSELIEKPFPEFTLDNLENDKKLDTRLFEGRVSLVNVFGSWCSACTVEHPLLMEISQRDDIQMIGVNWRDQRPNANRWLAQYGNPYDAIIFDADSRLIVDLGVVSAPETFIVDRSGAIRYKHVGIITPKDWNKNLRPIVESLMEVNP